jgi:hypothetical protein
LFEVNIIVFKNLLTIAGGDKMCSDEFKKKVEELVAKLEDGVENPAIFQIVEQIVLSDPELANFFKSKEIIMEKLTLKLEPQAITYDDMESYFPQKWEMPREGKMLYTDEELQRALVLIMYNLGIQKSLEVIPDDLIKDYLRKKTKSTESKD